MPDPTQGRLNLSVGVTAHRDLLPSEVPGIRRRVEDFFTDLQNEYPDLPLQLMTPLAAGGDQLVAEVAFSIGIRVVALLPNAHHHNQKN